MVMTRVRLGALALAVAGVLFVLYPAIRPYSDETSLEGAAGVQLLDRGPRPGHAGLRAGGAGPACPVPHA
jgi:hypothetical protein